MSQGAVKWVNIKTEAVSNCPTDPCYCTDPIHKVVTCNYQAYKRLNSLNITWSFNKEYYDITGGSGISLPGSGHSWKPLPTGGKGTAEQFIRSRVQAAIGSSVKNLAKHVPVEVPCNSKILVSFYQKVVDLNVTGSGILEETSRFPVPPVAITGGIDSIGIDIGDLDGPSVDWDYAASWKVRGTGIHYTEEVRVKTSTEKCE